KSVFSLRWNCKELRKIMKLRAIIMKIGVPGQEGAEGNAAERFSNEMLVQILLGGHSTLSLEGGLSGNRDEEKKSGPQFEVPTLVEAVAYRRRLTIITKLTEIADSSRLQDKMKVVFSRVSIEDESFIGLMHDLYSDLTLSLTKNRRLIAELEALGQRGDALKPLKYMREMVARDFVTLGVLEQLLVGTHVGMRLKDGYVADMEETE
nr:zinc finger, CCHC-type [Tanacetum cinerariifolium]